MIAMNRFTLTNARRLGPALALALLTPMLGQTTAPVPKQDEAVDVVHLSPFQVNVAADRGYRSTNSASATRIAMKVQDLPFNISILNQEVLTDLGLYDLDKAFRYMVDTDNNGNPPQQEMSRMRGFQQIAGSHQRNSFRYGAIKDNFNVERIEVVRGPNSSVVGEADPGGQINSVTKKALFGRTFGEVKTVVGSYDLWRSTVDVNASTTVLGAPVALRLNGLYHTADSFIKFAGVDIKGLALNLSVQLTRRTNLNVDFELTDEDRIQEDSLGDRWLGAPGYFGGFYEDLRDVNYLTIPSNPVTIGKKTFTTGAFVSNVYAYGQGQSLAGPDHLRVRNARYGNFTLDQEITRSWFVQLAGSLAKSRDYQVYAARGGLLYGNTGYSRNSSGQSVYTPGGRFFQLRSWDRTSDAPYETTVDLRFSTNYKLELPWMEQNITAGIDTFYTGDSEGRTTDQLRGANNAYLELPVYFDTLTPAGLGINRWLNTPGASWFKGNPGKAPKISNDGMFISASGSYLKGKLRTLLGVRRDETTRESFTGTWVDAAKTRPLYTSGGEVMSKATSPIYSISFAPQEGVMLFYTHAKSYKPSTANRQTLKMPINSLDPFGEALPPESGEGDEYGLKLDLFNHKVGATISYFDILKDNVTELWIQSRIQQLFNDPSEQRRFYVPGVSAQSKGIEVEVVLNPTPKISMLLGYANLDSINVRNPNQPAREGTFSDASYKNSGYFLFKYTETDGILKGFYTGLGSVIRGKLYKRGDWPEVTNPGYIVFNPFIGFQKRMGNRRTVGAVLSVENILDVEYLKNYSRFGEPRNFTLSAFLKF